jgi:hypothetical protein
MTARDVAALQSWLSPLRAALDRFEEMLAQAMSAGLIKASPVQASGSTFHCAHGHADVVYRTPDCPVCTMKRRAGYSEKWCERCEEITPHVGGMHIHARCVACLSRREVSDAVLSHLSRPHSPDWLDVCSRTATGHGGGAETA